MSNQLKIFRHEGSASELAPIGVTRSGQHPANTTKIEREALDWLVSQLKFQRTLEVLRTQGPAPDQPHQEYLAA